MPSSGWIVGDVKITRVVEMETVGGTRFILPQATPEEIRKLPWLVPAYASDEGRLRMAIHPTVIETPTRRILVDTGLGNDKDGRNVPTWNHRDTPFLEYLSGAGYPPETIDTVLCTHLHVDHVGWNTRLQDGRWIPSFPNARYVFARTEYEHWRDHRDDPAHPPAHFDDSVQPVFEAGVVDLVPGDHVLCEEVSLIPTPGHSPGHVSIHVRSNGAEALLTGDAAHHPCQMAHLDWSTLVDFDPQQAARTRHDLFSRFADTDTIVIGGHFSAGRLKRDGHAFRLEAIAP